MSKLKRLPNKRFFLDGYEKPVYPRVAAEQIVVTHMVAADPDGPCDWCDGKREVLAPVLASDWMVTRCPACRGEEWVTEDGRTVNLWD